MNSVLALALASSLALQPQGVDGALRLSPDTVSIGDPFVLTVRVRAPLGSTIVFPRGPDSSSTVRLLDPVSTTTEDSTSRLVQVATYRMAAWDLDEQLIRIEDVIVTTAGATHRLSLRSPSVVVMSVLPADSSLHVPKPARDIFGEVRPWWYPWVPLLLLAVLLALLAWWWYRRRQPAQVSLDPHTVAEREFSRVESLRLVEAGERGRYVALMADVLRDYLAASVEGISTSQTSRELVESAWEQPVVPAVSLERLLYETDLVKFARRPLTADSARRLGRDCREMARVIANAISSQRAAEAERRKAA